MNNKKFLLMEKSVIIVGEKFFRQLSQSGDNLSCFLIKKRKLLLLEKNKVV